MLKSLPLFLDTILSRGVEFQLPGDSSVPQGSGIMNGTIIYLQPTCINSIHFYLKLVNILWQHAGNNYLVITTTAHSPDTILVP